MRASVRAVSDPRLTREHMMSNPENSSESIAYLPGAGDGDSAAVATGAETGGDAQDRLAALEHQLAESVADRDDRRRQRDELRDEVLELPEELEVITNSRAFRIMKSGPLLAMHQPLSTLLIISSMGLLTNLWSFTPMATSIYIGVGSVVLLISALQFWASND